MAFPLNVAIVSSIRTACGRAVKGTLRITRPDDMIATVMRGAAAEVKGLEPKDIDDVIIGCAMPEAEQGLNVARNAVFILRWPSEIPAETVNRFCSSGLQAIVHGAMSIQTGLAQIVMAGGVESMSMVPMGGNTVRLNPKLQREYPEAYIGMGITAERVAKRFEVSREQQDQFAYNSQMKAKKALADGVFAAEIVPLMARTYEGGKATEVELTVDECPRPDTTLAGLAKLKPVFMKDGTVTPGNSSPLSDGAAASVLMSDAKVEEYGVDVLGRLRGFAVAGVDPDIMGIGPVPAIRKLLAQVDLKLDDIGMFEINEAFAAQSAYCQRELGIPDDKLNVYGGAIALGHPLGGTGAKLTATLLHGMKRRGDKYGIVSMCIGGGMGAAALYEAP